MAGTGPIERGFRRYRPISNQPSRLFSQARNAGGNRASCEWLGKLAYLT